VPSLQNLQADLTACGLRGWEGRRTRGHAKVQFPQTLRTPFQRKAERPHFVYTYDESYDPGLWAPSVYETLTNKEEDHE